MQTDGDARQIQVRAEIDPRAHIGKRMQSVDFMGFARLLQNL